jgi:hypothetical protein
MKRRDLRESRSIRPLKYPLRDVPHATVETNRTCNIRCSNCYNIDKEHVKRWPEIKKEIDALSVKRNLQALTILGGEPTLHPDLLNIVAYIKSRNIRCQVLTNGLVFLSDSGDTLLDALRSARIDRITLHVDYGQTHVHRDIEQVRTLLFEKCERRKIHFSLSITIAGSDRAVIPELVKNYAWYCYFDGILAVLGKNPCTYEGATGTSLEAEYSSIAADLGIEPCTYVPSNIDEEDVRWLIYYYFVNSRTNAAFAVSPSMYSLFTWLYHVFDGRSLFLVCAAPGIAAFVFLLSAVFQVVAAPSKIRAFLRCIRASSLLKAIRFHYIAIQVPPEFDESGQTLKMCFHCPDATIRNGLLLPVCLADFISPLDFKTGKTFARDPRYELVFQHFECTDR